MASRACAVPGRSRQGVRAREDGTGGSGRHGRRDELSGQLGTTILISPPSSSAIRCQSRTGQAIALWFDFSAYPALAIRRPEPLFQASAGLTALLMVLLMAANPRTIHTPALSPSPLDHMLDRFISRMAVRSSPRLVRARHRGG